MIFEELVKCFKYIPGLSWCFLPMALMSNETIYIHEIQRLSAERCKIPIIYLNTLGVSPAHWSESLMALT